MKLRSALENIISIPLAVILAMVFPADGAFGYNAKGQYARSDTSDMETFLELLLSDAQQINLISILNRYRDDRKDYRNNMLKLKKGLSTILNAEEYNEEEVRKAFQKTSAIREEMFLWQQKMLFELKSILTVEQLQVLKKYRLKKNERSADRLNLWAGDPIGKAKDGVAQLGIILESTDFPWIYPFPLPDFSGRIQ